MFKNGSSFIIFSYNWTTMYTYIRKFRHKNSAIISTVKKNKIKNAR